MAKKEVEREDAHRQITPVLTGEAAEIWDWLESLFHLSPRDAEPGKVKSTPDSFPERVVLRQMIGRDMGPELMSETWKPTVSAPPSREQLVALANRFLARAQKDASVQGHRTRYLLLAYSPFKGSAAYERYPFVLMPGGKEFKESEAPATDDEDTHRDRLLSTALDHARWKDEQFSESISGVLALQQEIIREQRATITSMEADRRAWMLATEEALSKKLDREVKLQWAQTKNQVVADMWTSAKSLLPLLPTVAGALTDGKAGFDIGIRTFLDALTADQAVKLFGGWEGEKQTSPGILDAEQCRLIRAIAKGEASPARLADIAVRQEQVAAAQRVLKPDQLMVLGQLLGAAAKAKGPAPTAPANSHTVAARSPEQLILIDLIRAVEERKDIELKIFGTFDNPNGQFVVLSPGILSKDQIIILHLVFSGGPVEALDDLMPGSGKPVAISPEQQQQIEAAMTPTMLKNLRKLIALRAVPQ